MTPQQKIKAIVLARLVKDYDLTIEENEGVITAENVDDIYDSLEDDDCDNAREVLSELREGDVETEIPAPWSRHYESKSVAAKLADGSWVGWTYWYGGGKHGEPEAIDWVSEAYELKVTGERTVTITEFEKVEG